MRRVVGAGYPRETANGTGGGLVSFMAGLSIPLILAAVALRDHISEAFYWVITFNTTVYRNQGTAEWAVTDLLAALTLLIVIIRCRNGWLLGLLAAVLIYIYPRPTINNLAVMLPLVAIASLSSTRRIVQIVVVVGALFSLSKIADEAHIISVETPQSVAVMLGNAGARAGDRIWLLPEVDQNGTIYAWGDYLPTRVWMPTRTWFRDVVEGKYVAALEAELPPYAVTYDFLAEQIPAEYAAILNANYEAVTTWRKITVWRLAG